MSRTSALHAGTLAVAALASSASAQLFQDLRRTHVTGALPDHALALAIVDIDQDGDLDIVVGDGDPGGGDDSVLVNTGGGVFVFDQSRLPTLPSPGGTLTISAADFDGDGRQDVFFGNAMNGPFPDATDRVYPNDGMGGYSLGTTIASTSGVFTFDSAAGDFDGDGDPDLLLAAQGGTRLLRNDGAFVFTDVTASSGMLGSGERNLVSFDVDNDGDLDAVVTSAAELRVLTNDGLGVFTSTSFAVPMTGLFVDLESVDAEGDGDRDLVIVNSSGASQLMSNDGMGGFSVAAAQLPQVDRMRCVVAADIDGDGDEDLLAGREFVSQVLGPRRQVVFVNDGSGVFTDESATRMPASNDHVADIVVGDLDGDGDLDCALGTIEQEEPFQQGGRPNRVYLNDGTGRFLDGAAGGLPETDFEAGAVVAADFDGDGRVDLYSGNQPVSGVSGLGRNVVFVQGEDGRFTDEGALQLVSDRPIAGITADFDGDGDLDIATANESSAAPRLFRNLGGSFEPTLAVGLFPDTAVLAAADLDGDADMDLVSGQFLGGVGLSLNDGTGTFTFTQAPSSSLPGLSGAVTRLQTPDIDLDGDPDLVVELGGVSHLWLNDGTGVFQDVTAMRLPMAISGLLVADVDLDGDDDLLGSSQLLLNNGDGTFVDGSAALPPVAGSFSFVFDVDGDGDLDFGRPGQYLRNEGAGAGFTVFAEPSLTAGALVVADLDGDGDADVVENSSSGPVVRSNTARHLFAPRLPALGQNYEVEVHARLGGVPASALTFLGVAPAAIDLGAFGILRIDPVFLLQLPVVNIPQPAGVATTGFPIPVDPVFAGVTLYLQSIVVAPMFADRPLWLTNVVVEPIAR